MEATSRVLVAGATGALDAAAITAAVVAARPDAVVHALTAIPKRGPLRFVRTLARELASPKPYRIPAWLGRLVAPLPMADLESRIPVSNAKAKRELQWSPQFPTYREGLGSVGERLARAVGTGTGMVAALRRDRRGAGS